MEKRIIKKMQDQTPHDVRCERCSAVIIPAERVGAYRQRTIDDIVRNHKCPEKQP